MFGDLANKIRTKWLEMTGQDTASSTLPNRYIFWTRPKARAKPLLDKSQMCLYTHLLVLDVLFFNGQLER